MNIIEISRILATWAANKPLVQRLYIFGSRARGHHRPDSDIDIAIELDMCVAQGVDDSGGLATWIYDSDEWEEELQALLPFEIDLEQVRSSGTQTVQKGLQRSSILVYEKARVVH